MLLMTLGFPIQARLCSRKLLFQRRHSKNWECSCLTWWSKECGKLGKAEKVNSQRPSLKVAVSRNAFWAVFRTALLQEQLTPKANYLKTDYMHDVQLGPRWSQEQISNLLQSAWDMWPCRQAGTVPGAQHGTASAQDHSDSPVTRATANCFGDFG